jgi:hypothetical protein
MLATLSPTGSIRAVHGTMLVKAERSVCGLAALTWLRPS